MWDDHEHIQDIFIADGSERRQDPWVIGEDQQLAGPHSGSICVHDGAEFTIGLRAHHSGSLTFRTGSVGRIVGKHSGSLYVANGARVEVSGDQSGSTHVEAGALLSVEQGGKLAGSLYVAGQIENRGVRGGSVSLAGGEIRDLDRGTVKEPTQRNGMTFYQW